MTIRLLAIALLISVAAKTDERTACAVDPIHRDVTYARVAERVLPLDIYLPKLSDGETAPLVIWIHGGAWRSGSKSKVPITGWLDEGFAIASVDYRLSPEARFPAQVHDIKAAIRFLRHNADKYRFDESKFIVAGASAGGHLAALVGVSNHHAVLEGNVGSVKVDSSVQAIVSFYGASNLESILSQSTEHGLSVRVPALRLLLGDLPDQVPDLAKLASPISHIEANDPPLFLIHGDADPQMPPEQSNELHAAYQQRELKSQLFVVKGGQHGGAEFYTQRRLKQLAKLLKQSLSDAHLDK